MHSYSIVGLGISFSLLKFSILHKTYNSELLISVVDLLLRATEFLISCDNSHYIMFFVLYVHHICLDSIPNLTISGGAFLILWCLVQYHLYFILLCHVCLFCCVFLCSLNC